MEYSEEEEESKLGLYNVSSPRAVGRQADRKASTRRYGVEIPTSKETRGDQEGKDTSGTVLQNVGTQQSLETV